ncbi:hypothetical protein MIC448_40005 [Microbacterium sp. C448]|nr:hypothetical protein MIC448_40005 [Microbacterium sp. C448]
MKLVFGIRHEFIVRVLQSPESLCFYE